MNASVQPSMNRYFRFFSLKLITSVKKS
jgi:hypothetical protein